MTDQASPNVAIFYDDDAYVETLRPPSASVSVGPVGLMGRQVAGKEFLDAYLSHGKWSELVALVRNRQAAESLLGLCKTHPSSKARVRRLRTVEESEFHAHFFPSPPARLLYFPVPLDERYVWARQSGGPHGFALCGVTHTLCSIAATARLQTLVIAPFESYDALICTSKAVLDMVRALTGAYIDYLRDRHGGQPRVKPRLEVIPLGVNTSKFRPASGVERAAQRRALQVTDDEVMVLFVGRLSHHAKAHPFPLFQGAAQAARATGRKVHLVLAGWAINQDVGRLFLDLARCVAPGVRVSVVDGTDQELRQGVWHAADVFASLPDNIQETFGLVIVEAMSSGLPVVASDWDGYRDLVVPGSTGLLVPTRMVPGATASATAKLVLGEWSYDRFLAECSQAVAVDVEAVGNALARLIADADLRRTLGAAGRQRALERFDWVHVIAAYEALWRDQQRELLARSPLAPARPAYSGPACYPAPEHTFASYPTAWLRDEDLLEAAGNLTNLQVLLKMPLTSHVPEARCHNPVVLQAILRAAVPASLGQLIDLFGRQGVSPGHARASLAWLLKYGLLRTVALPTRPEGSLE